MYVQISKENDSKYSENDILEVYNYVISENEKYEKLYEKNNYDGYLEKIRDLTVFDKYDFIKKGELNEKEKGMVRKTSNRN